MSRPVTIVALISLAVLAACSALPEKNQPEHGPIQILYSPTGDPLNGGPLGRPTCAEAMKHWFDRVDKNHNSAVTLDEFLNDAKAQLQRMDIDRNGYLVSEELERFRMAYRDFPAEKKADHGENSSSGAGGISSVIDPVMSADTNLDYKVMPDEFLSYSRKTFANLDAAHNSQLSLAEVTAVMCGVQGHDEH